MRYQIFKIEPNVSYMISIGSKEKPDIQFRERVTREIDNAMMIFERQLGASHSVAIVADEGSGEERGEGTDLPEIRPGGQYLIFALFSSGEHTVDSREKEEAIRGNQAELARGFMSLLGAENVNDINIGLVVLQDCSVTLLSIYAPQGEGFVKGWIKRHPHGDAWIKG